MWKKTKWKMFRHGDVLLVQIDPDKVPATLDLIADPVLAFGEATGHAHRVHGPAELYQAAKETLWGPRAVWWDALDITLPANTRYLHVRWSVWSRAELRHEEHAPIVLPAGWYAVIHQREYVPGTVRQVRDRCSASTV